MRCLSYTAARRLGVVNSDEFEGRARALIGAHLWHRVAAMVLACVPRAASDDVVEALDHREQLAWWGDIEDLDEAGSGAELERSHVGPGLVQAVAGTASAGSGATALIGHF